MEELNVNFTIEQNEPLVVDFEAFDEPPTVEVVNTDYEIMENKPSINDVELVGNKTLDELGIQSKGDYALASDIPDITDYVKNTDYATDSVGGVVKVTGNHGLSVYKGMLIGSAKSFDSYNASANNLVISKGTLENVLTQYSKTVLTTQADYDALETKDENTLYLIEE